MAKGGGILIFVLYLILGLYCINFGLAFIPKIIEATSSFSKWIVFASGIFLIFGGITFLRLKRYTY